MPVPILNASESSGPSPTAIELRPDIYWLVEADQGSRCQLSYLLIGSYGNVLVGMPKQWRCFDRLFEGSGGLALVFPTERSHDVSSDLDLFHRFGPRWIVPESQAWAHVPANTPSYLSSIHVRSVDQFGHTYRWHVDFKTTRILAGWALPASAPSTLLLHRNLPGDIKQVALSLRNGKAAVPASSPRELAMRLQQLLASLGHVTWYLPGSTLLGCFDDIHFEQHDHDVLTPRQRNQLAATFRANGIEQRTSREWTWDGVSIRIPKAPRVLGIDSLDGVNLDPGDIWILTATQTATHILLTPTLSDQQRAGLLLELASSLPVNLPKLRRMILDRFGEPAGTRLLGDLKITQAETVAYFKRHRVKGLLGRPRPARDDRP